MTRSSFFLFYAQGKTFTIRGENDSDFTKGAGLVPQCAAYLFERIRLQQEQQQRRVGELNVFVSYLQVYCEQVFDLLATDASNCANSSASASCGAYNSAGLGNSGGGASPFQTAKSSSSSSFFCSGGATGSASSSAPVSGAACSSASAAAAGMRRLAVRKCTDRPGFYAENLTELEASSFEVLTFRLLY